MKNRRVYIVMCYNHNDKCTYISEVCSNKKKAEEHQEYISTLMARSEPDVIRYYWIFDQRVV